MSGAYVGQLGDTKIIGSLEIINETAVPQSTVLFQQIGLKDININPDHSILYLSCINDFHLMKHIIR